MKNKNLQGLILAFLAALFYAINVPISKILLNKVTPRHMAAFLYLGAGLGVGFLYLFNYKKEKKEDRLDRRDLPFTVGMVILDIIAPIFLMVGINIGYSSNASLIGNFEIVATSITALVFFKEKVSKRLCLAISLITLSCILVTFEGGSSLNFSLGSVFVLLATISWGFENNFTRSISSKSSFEIVTIKGIFSGLGALIIAIINGDGLPPLLDIALILLLGFVSYGLSIFMYIRAQKFIGASKTSAFYAITPFVGSILAFIFLGERITSNFILAFFIMVLGSLIVVKDTLYVSRSHIHYIEHNHDGIYHCHSFIHDHEFIEGGDHDHIKRDYEESMDHRLAHGGNL